MDRFIFGYNGNKYQETKKHLYDKIKHLKYEFVAEPYCGIFGFSRYYYLMKKDENITFLLNDINADLIESLRDIQKDIRGFVEELKSFTESEEYKAVDGSEFTKLIKTKHKKFHLIFRGFSEGVFNKRYGETKIRNFEKKIPEYEEFFTRCVFYNLDVGDFLKICNEKENILLYFDPPYFNSNNLYYTKETRTPDNTYIDGSTHYLRILEQTTKKKDFVFVMNKIDIIDYIFKDFNKYSYEGRYSNHGNNKKIHVVYSNIPTLV